MTSAEFPAEIAAYYNLGKEAGRLTSGDGLLEYERTKELLERFLPPPPAIVVDVGGGAGVYATMLARLGYQVLLLDRMPLHTVQARRASAALSATSFQVTLADARSLPVGSAFADAVLLFGPLYHLTRRADRHGALHEARRVLRPGGIVMAVGITRFASTLAGMVAHSLDDPRFVALSRRDLQDGQHRNPTEQPQYFTTAYFHHPDELGTEMLAAGLDYRTTLAIEGPAGLLQDLQEQWADAGRRDRLLEATRLLEAEPSLLGVSSHLLAIGYRRED